jgi:hypothetical protein
MPGPDNFAAPGVPVAQCPDVKGMKKPRLAIQTEVEGYR